VVDTAREIGNALRDKDDYHLVVVTSTVMPGTTQDEVIPLLEELSGKKCGVDFGVCYNPEFIALGSVIRDMLNPDAILIGESDERAGDMLERIYRQLCDNDPPVSRMNLVNAELTKLSVNTFVTTKITFANLVARLCERLPGGDVDVVTAALGLDSRIGRKYLTGAVGYGGPCFPRDNRALSWFAQSLGMPATLPEATDAANDEQIPMLSSLVQGLLSPGGSVAILGLSYKPDTDVVEWSQGILLAEELAGQGVPVSAYDPAALSHARKALEGKGVELLSDLEETVSGADVIVIVTPWDEFLTMPAQAFAREGNPRVVVDCWRALDAEKFSQVVRYVPLGVGSPR
jgi:UDPglucose 6-dehydrogenase